MRINRRWRQHLTRFGAVLAVGSSLIVSPLAINPASATIGGGHAPAGPRAVSPAGVFPPGDVVFRNVNSGLCLTYSPGDRGAAYQQACNDPHIDQGNFQWIAAALGGNNYEFVNQTIGGQCLSIGGSGVKDGDPVFIFDCHIYPSQTFTAVPSPNGLTDELVNTASGKCVAVGGNRTNPGAWVIQWTCDGGPEDLWQPFFVS